jgi:ankyrin repeat protein
MSTENYIVTPSLADQHWRLSIQRKNMEAFQQDYLEAIDAGHMWRLDVLQEICPQPQFHRELMERAVEKGHMQMFLRLQQKNTEWPLHFAIGALADIAARKGHIDFLKMFVADHQYDTHEYHENVLRCAADAGHLHIVRWLVEDCAADIAQFDNQAIKNAAENGHFDIVRYLVDAGAKLDECGKEALMVAVRRGQMETVEYLLGKDITFDVGDALYAAAGQGHADILRLFLSKFETDEKQLNDALGQAVYHSLYAAADVLLGAGADINASDGYILNYAISRKDPESVKYLLMRGARTDLVLHGGTVLMTAAADGQEETTRLLLDHGADPKQMQMGALRVSLQRGQKNIARILFAFDKEQLAQKRLRKMDEFQQTFGGTYTLDDLRQKKGASGETGLTIAAQTGKFDALVRQAASGLLQPDDLYHPLNGAGCVIQHLQENRCVGQFFDPAFWVDRMESLKQALEQMPAQLRVKVPLGAIAREQNFNTLQKKTKNIKLKPYGP